MERALTMFQMMECWLQWVENFDSNKVLMASTVFEFTLLFMYVTGTSWIKDLLMFNAHMVLENMIHIWMALIFLINKSSTTVIESTRDLIDLEIDITILRLGSCPCPNRYS